MSRANDIATAIVDRLKTIRSNAGFNTNVGAAVYRGRQQLAEPNACTLFEGEEDASGSAYIEPYTVTAIIHFTAEAAVVCDPLNPDVAGHDLAEDMQKALFSGSATLGGLLASPLIYTGRVIQPRKDGQAIVTVQIKLDALYTLTPANP
jgi:hypothetical protein